MAKRSWYSLIMDVEDKKRIYSNVLVWLSKASCSGAGEAQALLTAIAHITSLLEDIKLKESGNVEKGV
jgi:hypothetical protein